MICSFLPFNSRAPYVPLTIILINTNLCSPLQPNSLMRILNCNSKLNIYKFS